jgi:hypothetical protein
LSTSEATVLPTEESRTARQPLLPVHRLPGSTHQL